MKGTFPALDAVLLDSDRVKAATLDRLATDYSPQSSLLRYLVQLAESEEPKTQIAATALLKRYRERGALFQEQVVSRLVDLLSARLHWEATLHLLQMLAELPIPPDHAEDLGHSARGLLRHRNTFVRAWAYGALHHLAVVYPEYRSDVSPLLERAREIEAASVRARLRQLPPLANVRSDA